MKFLKNCGSTKYSPYKSRYFLLVFLNFSNLHKDLKYGFPIAFVNSFFKEKPTSPTVNVPLINKSVKKG